MSDKPQYHPGLQERKLVYAWEDELVGLRAANIDWARGNLKSVATINRLEIDKAELLAALKAMLEAAPDEPIGAWFNIIRAAIAKVSK